MRNRALSIALRRAATLSFSPVALSSARGKSLMLSSPRVDLWPFLPPQRRNRLERGHDPPARIGRTDPAVDPEVGGVAGDLSVLVVEVDVARRSAEHGYRALLGERGAP